MGTFFSKDLLEKLDFLILFSGLSPLSRIEIKLSVFNSLAGVEIDLSSFFKSLTTRGDMNLAGLNFLATISDDSFWSFSTFGTSGSIFKLSNLVVTSTSV